MILSGCVHAGSNGHEHSNSPDSCLLHDGLTARGFTVHRSSLPNADAVAVAAVPLIILTVACKGTTVQRVISLKKAMFLGKISFSIYFTHWIVIQVANRVLPSLGGAYSIVVLQLGLVRTAVVSVSFLTYRLVKLSLQRWGGSLSLKSTIQAA